MRISDWSSDVCSSDLNCAGFLPCGQSSFASSVPGNHALAGHWLRFAAAFDALHRNPKTKSLTFSEDISHGLRDALPDPRRYRLKLTMSVPANSRSNRLLRRPSPDRLRVPPYRPPPYTPSLSPHGK